MPTSSAVLFDFDGVIADTGLCHAEAWEITFRNGGLIIPYKACLPAVELEDHFFVSEIFKSQRIKADPREWVKQKQQIYRQLLSQVKIFPGIPELIQALSPYYLLAVVSSAWLENIETVLNTIQLREYFKVLVGKESVTVHKPAPEGYLKAAEILEVLPQNCIVFEDSPSGIRSAKAAGMQCIGVANKKNPEQLGEADQIVPDFEDTKTIQKLIQMLSSRE